MDLGKYANIAVGVVMAGVFLTGLLFPRAFVEPLAPSWGHEGDEEWIQRRIPWVRALASTGLIIGLLYAVGAALNARS